MIEKSEHIIRREHYVTGREDERERIIALIENMEHSFWVDVRTDELIARIEEGVYANE